MRYLLSPYLDPSVNLALEEYLFNHFAEDDDPVFLLWRNRQCLVLGKSQNAFRELRWLAAQREGLPVLRRISGGGTVYHDLQNLNFSFLARRSEQTVLNFAEFLKPIVRFLNRMGLSAYLAEPSDLKIGERKISGNAQAVGRICVLHHGTLLFNSDLNALQHWLTPHQMRIRSKAIRSNPSPVINLADALRAIGRELDLAQFQAELISAVCAEGTPLILSAEEEQAILRQATERYEDYQWNYGRSPRFTYQVERTAGDLSVQLEVTKGVITQIQLGRQPSATLAPEKIRQVEQALAGRRLFYEELVQALRDAAITQPDELLTDLFEAVD